MRRIVLLLALGVSFGMGAWLQAHRRLPTPHLPAAVRQMRDWIRPERGFNDVSGRRQVDCRQLAAPGTVVLLTLGQSNAANEGSLGYPPPADVFNFNFLDGRCYAAADPLLGATGNGASVWTRVGRGLIEGGRAERVVIAPIAVGGTRIRRWTTGGRYHSRIARAAAGLAAVGLHPDYVLWHQGETDARHTGTADYTSAFAGVRAGIRAVIPDAPIYVAVASVCGHPGSDAVRAAQRALPNLYPDVRPGPDTDQLDRLRWRRDGCHFNAEGLDEHARGWIELLLQAPAIGPPD